MKVLSVRQPWAWALIFGGKDVENRSWKTLYRGPLAISASKGSTKREYDYFVNYVVLKGLLNVWDIPKFEDLERSKIIGVVKLVDVVKDSHSPWFEGDRAWHGKTFTKQNYGWIVTNPYPIVPVQFKGSLGVRELSGVRLNLSPSIQT